jgi:hypothetical protein
MGTHKLCSSLKVKYQVSNSYEAQERVVQYNYNGRWLGDCELQPPTSQKGKVEAVPWLRRLVAALSPLMAGFASGSVHMGFVVDEVSLGQVLRFSPVSIIPPWLSIHILVYHLGDEQ